MNIFTHISPLILLQFFIKLNVHQITTKKINLIVNNVFMAQKNGLEVLLKKNRLQKLAIKPKVPEA